MYSKMLQTETDKFQAERKESNYMLPQISPNIHCISSTRVLEHDSKYI